MITNTKQSALFQMALLEKYKIIDLNKIKIDHKNASCKYDDANIKNRISGL
jgi:hypothetical protein